jgi:Na+-transporting NADH:ubiquinone oxidoreductase subunit B
MRGWHIGETSRRLHSCNSQQRIHRLLLLSLLPVSIVALFNVGYQYMAGLANTLERGTDDLAGRVVQALGASHQDPGFYDYLVAGLAHMGPILIVALITGAAWERLIAERRQRPFEPGFIVIALLFTLLLPGAAPLSHVIFGMSFAILVGKGIFGGEGKTFLSPALLAIAIVQISFPAVTSQNPLWQGLSGYTGSDAIALYHRGGEAALASVDINLWSALIGSTPGPIGTTSVLAVLLGAAILLFTRIIAWRLLLAQIIGLVVTATLFNLLTADSGAGTMPAYWHLLLGSFAFSAVYLACDPVASSCTNPGRWIQGFLIGALVVLIRVANPTHPDAVIPVILLASILAPLIDHAVVTVNIRRRARRHV